MQNFQITALVKGQLRRFSVFAASFSDALNTMASRYEVSATRVSSIKTG